MKNTKQVTLGDKLFVIHTMKPRTVLGLQKPLARLASPIISAIQPLLASVSVQTAKGVMEGTVDDSALGNEILSSFSSGTIDLNRVSRAIQEAMSALSEGEQDRLICDLLANVQFVPKVGGAEFLTPDVIDEVFLGAPNDIYKLAFEVVRFNDFLPFFKKGNTGLPT